MKARKRTARIRRIDFGLSWDVHQLRTIAGAIAEGSEGRETRGTAGPDRLLRNSESSVKLKESHPQGAEAQLILLTSSARLKSYPDTSCLFR